jgi:hypothetical protein
MDKILIHKGDCTVFANNDKFLTFYIDTDLDMTGWCAEFKLFSITRKITNLTNKSFEVKLSHKETSQLLCGYAYGSVILTDNKGNVKTIVNDIPFEITSKVVENTYQEVDLTIPESSGIDIKLKVGAETVTSVNGMTGDVYLDIPSIEGLATEQQLQQGLDTKQDKGDYATNSRVNEVEELIPDITPLATKQELTQGLNTKQNKGDYALAENVPTQVSQLENDSNFATQTQVMQAIASIPQFSISLVDELPLTGEKMVLYLVSKGGEAPDVYDEYIWIEQTSSFEFLGTTAVDLTGYVKNTDYATNATAGVVKVGTSNGLYVNPTTGVLSGNPISLSAYQNFSNYAVIAKGTLDNVLTQYKKVSDPMTEEAYNALETKDANTLYLIEE